MTKAELLEKAKKLNRLADIEVFQKEVREADREFMQLPPWVRESLEGDRMSDGSDEQEYANKEEK